MIQTTFFKAEKIRSTPNRLKGVLSSHKSVTGILPNNPTMLPPFLFVCMNFHPYLSDKCSGLMIRLERSQCFNQTPRSVVFQRSNSCVLKKQHLCSKDVNFDAGMHDARKI